MFVLNRPEKLNALNLNMIRNIGPQLKAWDVSKLSKVIIMKGAGKGKFSVGDDILGALSSISPKSKKLQKTLTILYILCRCTDESKSKGSRCIVFLSR
jgi:enoyl-CoA hydratase/carnithine racemase